MSKTPCFCPSDVGQTQGFTGVGGQGDIPGTSALGVPGGAAAWDGPRNPPESKPTALG